MARIQTVDQLTSESLAAFDEIIDVRSPAEFAEDHVPGAINLPVLSNDERAEVGTIYVQDSRFRARRLGASLVARNIADHLQHHLADKPGAYKPLIYCWRGGMRSNAMATVLSSVGWRTAVVSGGYKTWRRAVVDVLSDSLDPLPIILLDGQTGTAKTEIISTLAQLGVQTLDLEGLAHHRGSVFGGYDDEDQPRQKFFESLLLAALRQHDLSRPIVVEAESSLIGRCTIPRRLLAAMRTAPRIEVRASLAARARFLVCNYSDVHGTGERLDGAIRQLAAHHSRETIAAWLDLSKSGQFDQLAQCLARDHYDPLYTRKRRQRCGRADCRN